jgi:beta-lactam-binding protein with PASTA domain
MSCDPNFADVSLLLHCDGTNGSTSFPDSSANAFAMTPSGVTVDTSAPEFGTGAANFGSSFNSNTITTPITGGGPLDMQAGDFTVEGWVKLDSSAVSCLLVSSNTTGAIHGGFEVSANIGGTIDIGISLVIAGTRYAVGTTAITATPGVWYSWAAVRQGTEAMAFLNGVASLPVTIPVGAITSDTHIVVGGVGGLGSSIVGEMDEIRITKGLARYTGNYTPAGPFGGTCAVTVPNVVGEVLATAESDITAALLTVGTVTTGNSPTIPAGSVVSQSPIAGAIAMQGDPVSLVNSLGPAPVAVPNVVGLSLADASATLLTVGFFTGTVTLATSLTVPVGDIISQSPTAGTFETPGTNVDLVESEGPSALLVPDLTNLSVPVAEALLTSIGLVLGIVSEQPDAIIIKGNIDAQGTAAGTPASPGDAVNVTISSGLPSLLVPDLFGLTQSDAVTLLQSLGLVVGAIGTAPSTFLPPGEVETQNPSAGTPVAAGSIVSFVLAIAPPAVGTLFDVEATVISQYANSPTLLQLVANMNQYVDQSANMANFYNYVWNIDSAVGFGLDIWGKIVNVSRLLQIPNTTDYVGFDNSATPPPDWQTMGSTQTVGGPVGGAMYTGQNATTAYLLPDDAYRQLILAKAFANICTTTAPAINQILQNLYGPGTAWVLNTGPMAISYNLSFTPTAIQLAILEQSGVIPTPPGVSVTINTGV